MAQTSVGVARRGRGLVVLGATLMAAGALIAGCGTSDGRADPTTTRPPTTTAAPTTAPTTSTTADPLDAAFAAAGYRTPIDDEVRVAVATFCHGSAADIAANLTEAMRAPLEIGFRVECPDRLVDLAAAPGH